MAELGTFPHPPPEQQGTEKSHHFFGLCGGSARGVGRRAERARRALRKRHLSRAGLAGSSGRKVTVRPRRGEWPWRRSVSAYTGGWGTGTPPPATFQERQSLQRWPRRAGPGGDEKLHCHQGRWPDLAHFGAAIFPTRPP